MRDLEVWYRERERESFAHISVSTISAKYQFGKERVLEPVSVESMNVSCVL